MNKYYAYIQQPGHSNIGNKEQQTTASVHHAHAYTHTRSLPCRPFLVYPLRDRRAKDASEFRRFFPRGITNEPDLSEGIIFMCTVFEKWTER